MAALEGITGGTMPMIPDLLPTLSDEVYLPYDLEERVKHLPATRKLYKAMMTSGNTQVTGNPLPMGGKLDKMQDLEIATAENVRYVSQAGRDCAPDFDALVCAPEVDQKGTQI